MARKAWENRTMRQRSVPAHGRSFPATRKYKVERLMAMTTQRQNKSNKACAKGPLIHCMTKPVMRGLDTLSNQALTPETLPVRIQFVYVCLPMFTLFFSLRSFWRASKRHQRAPSAITPGAIAKRPQQTPPSYVTCHIEAIGSSKKDQKRLPSSRQGSLSFLCKRWTPLLKGKPLF